MTDMPSTDAPPSSSNRSPGVCDAVLARDDQSVGPVRLPISRSEDFIDQFNRVYGDVGLKVVLVIEPKTVPAS